MRKFEVDSLCKPHRLLQPGHRAQGVLQVWDGLSLMGFGVGIEDFGLEPSHPTFRYSPTVGGHYMRQSCQLRP